jgi:hypothetical protein
MDGGYGTGGIAYANTFAQDIWIGNANVAVDAEGRLYVPGTDEQVIDGMWRDIAVVTRFTQTGQVDTTFGTGGTANVALRSSSDSFTALGVDPSGRPIIGASMGGLSSPNTSDMLLIRLDITGQRDTSFGPNGERQVDVAARGDTPAGFAFTPDARLIAFATSTTPAGGLDFSAVRIVNDPAVIPAWLAPGGMAAWNPTTKTLNVSGAATITADPGADLPTIYAFGNAAALTINPASGLRVQVAALNLSGGARATLALLGAARTASSHRVLVTSGLNIDSTSTLNITDNDLVLDYSGINPIRGVEVDVRNGYNAVGDWLGKGITSSVAQLDGNYAVAVADNAALAAPFGTAQGGPLFAGVNVDLTTVLVKFTHRADLNLDGVVTPDDSAVFGGNYDETQPSTWATGDLNYDGLFTPDDSAIFGGAYDETVPLL